MGSAASAGMSAAVAAATNDDIKQIMTELSDESILKLKAALTAGAGPPVATLSDDAKKKLAEKGWDKGIVFFGNPASEATVKVAAALALLKKEHTHVDVSFDDKPLEDKSVGVKSNDWKLLSGGYSCMPALCVDGVMYMESVQIVQMLAVQEKTSKEVMDLIEFVAANDGKMLEAAKHWGWHGFHDSMGFAIANKEHYSSYGKGNKDEAWEKETAAAVKAFLEKLEAVLAARKEINGYYVGDGLTLADCVLCNWPLTLGGVAGVDIEKKFPKVQANYAKLKELNPPGMQVHLEHFPGFVGGVQGANKEKREAGFDINKSM